MKKILTNTLPLCLAFVLTGCDSRFSGDIAYTSGRFLGYVIAIALFTALFYGLIGLFKKDLTKKSSLGLGFWYSDYCCYLFNVVGTKLKVIR